MVTGLLVLPDSATSLHSVAAIQSLTHLQVLPFHSLHSPRSGSSAHGWMRRRDWGVLGQPLVLAEQQVLTASE